MDNINKQNKRLLIVGFILTILYSLHYAIPIYLNSTLLSNYFSATGVNLIYMASGVCALIFANRIGKYLNRYHNYKTSLVIILLDFIATIVLGFSQNLFLVAASFIITMACIASLSITLNLFIEEFTKQNEEGVVRGIFLTLLNTGILISPVIASSALSSFGYQGVYTLSALMLIPIAIAIKHYYKNIHEPMYKNVSLKIGLAETLRSKNIFGVMSAFMALECFYISMAIYIPMLLSQNTDISIATYLGVIMPFVLIPFVILPYQMGLLADKKTGEKEFLLLGLAILSISAMSIAFINTNSILIWGGILFFSRVGAAILETMIFIYFFKKTKKSDAGLVALFGNVRTIATIVVPIFGTLVVLITSNISYIFIVLSIYIALTIIPANKIIDTR